MTDHDLNEILMDNDAMSEDESEGDLTASTPDLQAAEEEYDNEDEDFDDLFKEEEEDEEDDYEDDDDDDDLDLSDDD